MKTSRLIHGLLELKNDYAEERLRYPADSSENKLLCEVIVRLGQYDRMLSETHALMKTCGQIHTALETIRELEAS